MEQNRVAGPGVRADTASAPTPAAVEIAYPQWTPEVAEVFKACAAHGVRIWANTMWRGLAGDLNDDAALTDPAAHYGWLLDRRLTVIQTDRPETLLTYLRARQLHP